MLKDVFRLAEPQEKATYGLVYELTLTRISENSVLNEPNATNNALIKHIGTEWHVPH